MARPRLEIDREQLEVMRKLGLSFEKKSNKGII